jgi:DNA-binding beta-propeller fold protein YncE
LRKLREQFPNELVIIGVHSAKFTSEQSTENIRQAVMREGIEHLVVNDAGMKTWNAYAVRAWPTLILIDPHGRIAGETSGEILAEDFSENIRDIIQQNPDAIDRTPLELCREVEMEPDRPLRFPAKLLLSGDRLFISDTGHNRILEVRLDEDGLGGEVVRVFGRGESGMLDGLTDHAAFNHPHGLSLAGELDSGSLYVADTENHSIRAISLASGEVTTLAGTGQKAHGHRKMGVPTETALRDPWAVLAIGEYVFIAMAGSHQIWVLIQGNQLGPFAGNGYEALTDGPVGEASFNQPSDLSFGMGYLFVADPEASAVRAISLSETPQVVTLVGQGLFDWGDQDGPTSEALLQHPAGLAFDQQVIYVADTYNNKIKMLDPVAGQVKTLVGSAEAGLKDGSFEEAQLFEPEGVQVHQGRLYIADTNNHQVRVADLSLRTVTTFHLKGLEHLPVASTVETSTQTLIPVTGGPGKLWVKLDVQLPEGYHRNTEAPIQLIVGHGANAVTYTFDDEEDVVFAVDSQTEHEVPLGLTLYYCKGGNDALCLIHSRALNLPVRVDKAAGDHVEVPYAVTE